MVRETFRLETVGHKGLRVGKIVYILLFYNISFSWLLPLDGFQFIFSLRDSENDLLVWDTNMADVSLFWDTNGRRDVVWKHCITHKLLTTLYLWYCLWRWPCSPAKCPEVDYQNANTVLSAKDLKKHMFVFHCHAFMSIKRKKKNRKRRHTQCSTEVQSHSVLHLFELFRRLSVYFSRATPRISWELKTKNTLKT